MVACISWVRVARMAVLCGVVCAAAGSVAQPIVVTVPTTRSDTIQNVVIVQGTTFTLDAPGFILGSVFGEGSATIINNGTMSAIGFNAITANQVPTTFDITNTGRINGSIVLTPANPANGGDDIIRISGLSSIGQFYNGGVGTDELQLIGTDDGFLNLNRLVDMERIVKETDDTIWSLQGFADIDLLDVKGGEVQLSNVFLDSEVSVRANGKVTAFGTITDRVTVNGEFTTFNSVASVVLNDNMRIKTGGRLSVPVSSDGSAGRINIAGILTIENGATFKATEDLEVFGPTTDVTVVTATGGIAGTFDTVTNDFAFLTPSLTYNSNDIVLTLTRNTQGFAGPAVTGNQRRVGQILEVVEAVADGGSDAETLTNAIAGLVAADVPAALDRLSGEGLASAPRVGTLASRGFTQGLQRRSRVMNVFLADGGGPLPAPTFASAGNTINDLALLSAAAVAQSGRSVRQLEAFTPGFWADVVGGTGSLDGSSGTADVDYDYAGLVGGFDFAMTNDWVMGFAVGYNRGSFDSAGLGTDGDTDSIYLGWYAAVTQGKWHYTAGMSYAFDSYDTSRNVVVGALNRSASGSYDGNTFGLDFGASYHIDLQNQVVLEPFGTFEYVNGQTNSYTESGAGAANLTVADATFDALYTTVGARLFRHFQSGTTAWTPEVRAGWQHEWIDDETELSASFTGAGVSTPFTVTGVNPEDDAALLGLGLTADFDRQFSLRLDYNTRIASDQTDHQFGLALRVPW